MSVVATVQALGTRIAERALGVTHPVDPSAPPPPSPPGLVNYEGHRGIPSWASLRTRTWQYTEYYKRDHRTLEFREYYDLTADPCQLHNLLADIVPTSDPDVSSLSAQLQRAQTCVGTTGPESCP